ncbi:ATP-binding protein [Lacibacterium aquatile]|uniref:histidine kinase n=1 Tax=Lacibacterium aquatile TaxID=1168082 RepID=A0ABW5E0H7_9PROT
MNWPNILLTIVMPLGYLLLLGVMWQWRRRLKAMEVRMERRRQLLDGLSTPLAMFDEQSTRRFANNSFRLLDGDKHGTLTEAATELARRVLRTRGPHVESLTVIVDGTPKALTITAFPVPEGVACQVADLSETERLMADLSRHIAAQDEVLNQVGQAIAIFGPDRRLKYANTAFLDLWQLPPEIVSREPSIVELDDDLRVRRLMPDEADMAVARRRTLSYFENLVEPLESLLHLPTGVTLHTRIAPHPFGGLIFTYADVTDKLVLERNYNTAIAVQRETLDNLAEGVAFFGLDRRLALFNPAFCRTWGLSEEKMAEQPTLDAIIEHCTGMTTGDDAAASRDRVIADIDQRRVRHGVDVRLDGQHTEFTWVPMPDGATLFLCLDVTDRARAEAALRERARALEEADRLKTEFIANVSYELRTPLNTIIGFAEILSQAYFGPINERQREYTDGILESSGRLLLLINDILDLATIEAGYMVLDREMLPVQPLLEATLGLVRERARARDLALTLDIPAQENGGGDLQVFADGKRMRQALFNLLSNACTFTQPGGAVALGATVEDGYIELFVADTGVGIATGDKDRVFERFERRGRSAGAGLGLSLVKSIIELHGGTVDLTSQPGKGTRVVCRLPVTEEPALPAA